MRKALYIGLAIILVVVTIIGIVRVIDYLSPDGIEINKSKYPVTGIDISKHNGIVNFRQIKEQKIDFVYMKATEGGDYVDNRFNGNYKKAFLNGLPIGIYHFFRFNVSGKIQANNFYNAIQGKNTDLPFVVDVEEWGNSGNHDKENVIREIRSFINEVENLTNKRVMIYTNENGFRKYIQGNFEKNELWICSFNSEPKIGSRWDFWQHSHKGKMKGITGLVDINTFNGSRAEWDAYLKELNRDD